MLALNWAVLPGTKRLLPLAGIKGEPILLVNLAAGSSELMICVLQGAVDLDAIRRTFLSCSSKTLFMSERVFAF